MEDGHGGSIEEAIAVVQLGSGYSGQDDSREDGFEKLMGFDGGYMRG